MMTAKAIANRARMIRSEVAKRISKVRGTLADYKTFVSCCHAGDYTAAHSTRLYSKYSTEYCVAVEVNCIVKGSK
jgi:hypothetical protein